jgi:uncharacterized protein
MQLLKGISLKMAMLFSVLFTVFLTTIVLGGFSIVNAQGLQAVPKLSARVTDVTATLSATDKATLESKLQAFEQRKGSQVAVLIVGTTAPEAIEQYSIRVVESWKLGRAAVQGKKVDDGVLLLVAKDDRKVRIEVGYGLEGSITDAQSKRIISEQIAPRFRAGDFVGGVNAGVDKLTGLIEGAGLPDSVKAPNSGSSTSNVGDDLFGTLLPILVIAFFSSMIFGRIFGSLVTGGAAAFLAAGTAIAPPIAFGVVAVGTFILASVLFGMRRGVASSPGSWNNQRGARRSAPVFIPGGWGGGGGFGGGSSGGGFGGGGGGFGGGGASGDW